MPLRSPALVLALALPLTSASTVSAIEVHAHRGATAFAPENSLAAFRDAIELGVDAIELDLQLTRDGVLVAHHDAELDGSDCRHESTGARASGRLRRWSAAELEPIRCQGEPIARFDEVLALVEQGEPPVSLIVELKFHGGQDDELRVPMAWRTLAALEATGLGSRTLIQSFDFDVLTLIESMEPAQTLGLLTRDPARDAARLVGTGIDVLLPRADRLSADVVASCHSRGVQVIAWTVNELHDLQRLIAWGVDGVITDRPMALLAAMGRPRSPVEAAAAPASSPLLDAVAESRVPRPTEPPFSLREVRVAAVMPFTSRGNIDTFCTTLFEEAVADLRPRGFPELTDVYRLPFPVVDGKPFNARSRIDELLQVARDHDAQAILVGEGNWYGPFGNRWRMEIRLIEVNQGRVLWSTAGKSGPSFSGPAAKREVVRECLRDFRRSRNRR